MAKFKKRKRPGPPEIHGAHSIRVRERYSSLRTKEGKRLAAVTKGLIADLGGEAQLSTAQQVIIGNIKSKLVVIYQISDWTDRQAAIVDEKSGELLPALGRNFLAYTDSVKRDLEALSKFATKPKKLKLADYIELKEVKSK